MKNNLAILVSKLQYYNNCLEKSAREISDICFNAEVVHCFKVEPKLKENLIEVTLEVKDEVSQQLIHEKVKQSLNYCNYHCVELGDFVKIIFSINI